MKVGAVGFDFGETLIYYGDAPLSWKPFYGPALREVARAAGLTVTPEGVSRAAAVLERYNTRCVPRLTETVRAEEIFGEVASCWGADGVAVAGALADNFFGFFRRGAAAYPEADATLQAIHAAGTRIGVLSDVPYGMDGRLLWEDVERVAGFGPCLDALLTSLDVGWRKPEPAGFLELAARLGVGPERMLFVGNEEKDVTGANRAGMISVLICRTGPVPDWGQRHHITTLSELPPLLGL